MACAKTIEMRQYPPHLSRAPDKEWPPANWVRPVGVDQRRRDPEALVDQRDSAQLDVAPLRQTFERTLHLIEPFAAWRLEGEADAGQARFGHVGVKDADVDPINRGDRAGELVDQARTIPAFVERFGGISVLFVEPPRQRPCRLGEPWAAGSMDLELMPSVDRRGDRWVRWARATAKCQANVLGACAHLCRYRVENQPWDQQPVDNRADDLVGRGLAARHGAVEGVDRVISTRAADRRDLLVDRRRAGVNLLFLH